MQTNSDAEAHYERFVRATRQVLTTPTEALKEQDANRKDGKKEGGKDMQPKTA